jgi:cardiolipin synthase
MPDGLQVGRSTPTVLLTLPNVITFGRLCAVPLAVWLVMERRFEAAFFLFLAAGLSDAVDGWLARRNGGGNSVGALLDPVADKALLVSMYVTLGLANHLPVWLVILVVFRDVLIIGGFLLVSALGHPMGWEPLLVSKLNTAAQIALVGIVLAQLGLDLRIFGLDAVLAYLHTALIYVVAATTVISGAGYLMRWTRSLAGTEAGS